MTIFQRTLKNIWLWPGLFAIFLVFNSNYGLISAEENPNQETQSNISLPENEWIKNHHGIIFYQDYQTDKYNMFKY